MRIAVLSDLHISTDAGPESLDRALGAFRSALDHRVDHVVVAGDVFDAFSDFEKDARTLRRELMAMGLWHEPKLTILGGNHDLFEASEHRWTGSSMFGQGAMMAKFAASVPLGVERQRAAFGAWASELLHESSLRSGYAGPFDKRVGPVRLLGLDTTPASAMRFTIGHWPSDAAMTVRNAVAGTVRPGVRNVLVMHHPPCVSEEPVDAVAATRSRAAFGGELFTARGFNASDIAAITSFVNDVKIEAIVCGHVHTGHAQRWRLGGAEVFLEGRTGNVHQHGGNGIFTVLDLPETGAISAEEVHL